MTCKEIAAKLADLGTVISPETIRKDWAKGAPRGSAEAYLRWREKHIAKDGRGSQEVRDLKAEKTRKEIELLTERHLGEKRANEIEAGELWRKSDVLAARRSSAAKVRAVLDSKLRVELPARLAGRSAEEIAVEIEAALDAAYTELSTS